MKLCRTYSITQPKNKSNNKNAPHISQNTSPRIFARVSRKKPPRVSLRKQKKFPVLHDGELFLNRKIIFCR